jgi:hypothetical protein
MCFNEINPKSTGKLQEVCWEYLGERRVFAAAGTNIDNATPLKNSYFDRRKCLSISLKCYYGSSEVISM